MDSLEPIRVRYWMLSICNLSILSLRYMSLINLFMMWSTLVWAAQKTSQKEVAFFQTYLKDVRQMVTFAKRMLHNHYIAFLEWIPYTAYYIYLQGHQVGRHNLFWSERTEEEKVLKFIFYTFVWNLSRYFPYSLCMKFWEVITTFTPRVGPANYSFYTVGIDYALLL